VLAACGGSDDASTSTGGTGTLSVKVTDAPATPEYREVWVTVEKVRVHLNEDAAEDDGGWQEIDVAPAKKIDLLTLRNGILADLGQIEVPAGQYHQFRLVLGSGATDNELVLADGAREALKTPSGQQSGLKLNAAPFDVADGQTVELVLDFDAARSVVKAGNSGKYLLKPVITVIPVLDAGAVADPVAAADASVSLQRYDPAGDSVTVLRSTTPMADGTWKLAPVEDGDNYNLVVSKPGYRTLVLTGATVVANETLAIDPLVLTPVAPDDTTTTPPTTVNRVASGNVAPAGTALVRALQRVVDEADTANDIVVEVAFMNADADTGAFEFALNVEPAQVGEAGGVLADGANAGIFSFAASTDTSSGVVADVDLNPGDQTDLLITLVAP
jgi:hypothetical protein